MLLSIAYLVFLFIFPLAQQEEDGWKLKREKDGISVSIREQADSHIKEYKARAVIAHPIQQVFDFFSDLEQRPEWVFRCTDLTIIENQGGQKIKYHTTYATPWPLKDWDLTAEVVYTLHEGDNKIKILTEDIMLDYPIEKGVIRMPDYREWVILERIDSVNTLFITEGYTNPGKSMPAWLINMFLVDGIYDSVVKTREILNNNK